MEAGERALTGRPGFRWLLALWLVCVVAAGCEEESAGDPTDPSTIPPDVALAVGVSHVMAFEGFSPSQVSVSNGVYKAEPGGPSIRPDVARSYTPRELSGLERAYYELLGVRVCELDAEWACPFLVEEPERHTLLAAGRSVIRDDGPEVWVPVVAVSTDPKWGYQARGLLLTVVPDEDSALGWSVTGRTAWFSEN